MEKEFEIIKDFIEGKITIHEFKKNYFYYKPLQDLAKKTEYLGQMKDIKTLDEYVGKVNFNNIFNMQLIFVRFRDVLRKYNIKFIPTQYYFDLADNFGECIPDFLSDDALDYVQTNILDKLDTSLPIKEQKKIVKKEIKKLFKFKKVPPEFVQEGHWPYDEKSKQFYIFEKQIEDGDKVTYYFSNPSTGEEEEYSEFY